MFSTFWSGVRLTQVCSSNVFLNTSSNRVVVHETVEYFAGAFCLWNVGFAVLVFSFMFDLMDMIVYWYTLSKIPFCCLITLGVYSKNILKAITRQQDSITSLNVTTQCRNNWNTKTIESSQKENNTYHYHCDWLLDCSITVNQANLSNITLVVQQLNLRKMFGIKRFADVTLT